MSEIIARLDRLERSNRRWRLAATAGLLFGGAAFLMGAADTGSFSKITVTESITIGDGKKGPTIVISVDGDADGEKGRTRIEMFPTGGKKPAVTISARSGPTQMGMVLLEGDEPGHGHAMIGYNGKKTLNAFGKTK